jgi:DNA-binding beta-propeller fold protein YncE
MSTVPRSLQWVGFLAALGVCAGVKASPTAYVAACCATTSPVTVISTAQGRAVGQLIGGAGSYAIAFPNANRAWIANAQGRSLSVVDTTTHRPVATIPLPLQPWLVKASPDGARVYVITGNFTGHLNHYSSVLLAFDAVTLAVAGSVTLANDGLVNPGLAIAADGSRVYATLDSQTVVVYDTSTGTVSATWQTSRALAWTASGTLTLSPDGGTLYTAGQSLTAIDTASGVSKGSIAAPGPAGTNSWVGSAVSQDGNTLYATFAAQIGTGGGIASINLASMSVTAVGSAGSEPQQPVLSIDGTKLFVPDAIDSQVLVIDAAGFAVASTIAVEGAVATATLSADGSTLYVPDSSTSRLLAVDPTTLGVKATVVVTGGADPLNGYNGSTAPSATADGSRVYVGGIQPNSVSAVSTSAHVVAHEFANLPSDPSVTGSNSPFLLATPDGRAVFLGTSGSEFVGAVPVIQTATGATAVVHCPRTCIVEYMSALPDSRRVYLSGVAPVGVSGSVPFFYVVDPSTLRIVSAPKHVPVAPMAAAPSGSYLYIASGSQIDVFDTTQNIVTGTLPIGGITAIAFSPDGATAYGASSTSLALIDTASGTVVKSIAFPTSITPLSIAVSTDGSQVWVTAGGSSSVIVVTPATGTVMSFDAGMTVSGVAFGAN